MYGYLILILQYLDKNIENMELNELNAVIKHYCHFLFYQILFYQVYNIAVNFNTRRATLTPLVFTASWN